MLFWIRPCLFVLLLLSYFQHDSFVECASWIVAASNSLPRAKARADVICDGSNDTAILRDSLMLGPLLKTEYDDNAWTYAYSGQSVEWLAGDYYLKETLVLPQVVDTVLEARGTILHYALSTGDAVVITGSLRTRFMFGTIWSSSGDGGAALAAKDRPYTKPFMPNLMSEISWQGLQHDPPSGKAGVGFHITKHFCVNRVSGTDVRGFDVGVFVDGSGSEGTIDTNWWWLSYVRGCSVNIQVDGSDGTVNSQQWHVNVDASLDGSVAIDTSASFDWWRIIMGDVSRAPSTRSIILEESAAGNVMEITPSLDQFDGYENRASARNNVWNQVPKSPPSTGKHSHLVHGFVAFDDGPISAEEPAGALLKSDLVALEDLRQSGLLSEFEYKDLRKRALQRY